MQSSLWRRVFFFVALASFAALAMGAACSQTIDDGLDAGPGGTSVEPLVCESNEECPDATTWDCLGICLKRCAADDACGAGEFCSNRSYCEQGCRDRTSCASDEVCVQGRCDPAANATSCGDKCDCAPGQVCEAGVCTDPPDSCGSSDDCGRGPDGQCNAYLCNGFTSQCFDPDPAPCDDASDCVGRPDCRDGCVCNGASQCVPGGECTPENEATVCGSGFYCTDELVCDVLPDCTSAAECAPLGLVCNEGTGQCEASAPCTDSSECTSPPATYCDTSLGSCARPRCDNGGATCGATEECVNGSCVPAGTGTACNSDADCPNEPWPDTQFCNFQTASGTGECSVGCRSNASCGSGQECNGQRQCVQTGGGGGSLGQAGDPCDEPPFDPDCAAGLVCTYYGTCEETCENPGPCGADSSCCPLTGYEQCEQRLLLSFCSP